MRAVSFIRPIGEGYAPALAAYRRGEFVEAIRLLGADVEPQATALRVRCYVREGRVEQALRALDALDLASLPEIASGELLALRATIKMRLREFGGSHADLVEARVHAYSTNSVALQSEIEYFASLLCYAQGDLSGAESATARALSTHEFVRPWQPVAASAAYPHSLEASEARALEVLGFVAASRADNREQRAFIRSANERFDASSIPDTYVEASLVHNYALIAKEIDDPGDVAYIRAKVAKIRWVESTRIFEFYTRHSLGWSNGFSGDHVGALREFRLAAQAAPTTPLKITAITDRAFLAKQLNEGLSAREDLEHAVELSKSVDWESKTGEERYALYQLAEQLAPFAVGKARQLLDLYFGLKTPLSVLVMGNHDGRLRAFECLAVAAVLQAEGNVARATINALEAFEIFAAADTALPAAQAAVVLAELTNEPKYRAYVEKVASERPDSWLMRRYRGMSVA